MQKITLYKYARADGGITVSPNKPEGDYTILYRLIADEGKVLTNGETTTPCTDTDNVNKWREVEEDISDTEALNIISGG
jgi:hypothetical protein